MWPHPASWLLKCLTLAPLPGPLYHPEVLCLSSSQALTQGHSLGSSSSLMSPPSGLLPSATVVSAPSLHSSSCSVDAMIEDADLLWPMSSAPYPSRPTVLAPPYLRMIPPAHFLLYSQTAAGGPQMGASQTHGLQPRPGHTPSKHASLSPAF